MQVPANKWLELELTKKGDLLSITALGSGHQRPAPLEIPWTETLDIVAKLTNRVKSAVRAQHSLAPTDLDAAYALYEAIFHGEIRDVLAGMAPSPEEPLVIRIFSKDRDLANAPWEALCKPGTNQGFIGTESELLVARGEYSKDAWQPREVNGAVRVLAIAPGESEQLLVPLRQTLEESIEAGEIEWLEPIVGSSVTKESLYNRLRRGQSPHIIHYLGHGTINANGASELRLADEDDDPVWLPAEALARELGARFSSDLRLVILEACEGAQAGALGTAAAEMLKAGADAVVAHLWPVRADVARRCSKQLYRSLTSSAQNVGDVGKSMAATRRSLLADSAEAFSPVLYLRGSETKIFDFAFRKVKRHTAVTETKIAPSLQTLLNKRFTMVLGDLDEERADLRKEIVTDLERRGDVRREHETLDSLLQRYVLRFGQGALHDLFQNALSAQNETNPPPLVSALGKHLQPGVHVTLLWQPHLERAIAAEHPARTIYAIQPPLLETHDSRVYVLSRPAGETDWREEPIPTPSNIDQDFIILRMYGGNTAEPNPAFTIPILTYDDHVQGLLGSHGLEPPAWMVELLGRPRVQPGLFVGLSSLDWRHRMLLRFLYDNRPAPAGSVALTLPSAEKTEMDIWERGAGLPGRSRISPIQEAPDDLAVALVKLAAERAK